MIVAKRPGTPDPTTTKPHLRREKHGVAGGFPHDVASIRMFQSKEAPNV